MRVVPLLVVSTWILAASPLLRAQDGAGAPEVETVTLSEIEQQLCTQLSSYGDGTYELTTEDCAADFSGLRADCGANYDATLACYLGAESVESMAVECSRICFGEQPISQETHLALCAHLRAVVGENRAWEYETCETDGLLDLANLCQGRLEEPIACLLAATDSAGLRRCREICMVYPSEGPRACAAIETYLEDDSWLPRATCATSLPVAIRQCRYPGETIMCLAAAASVERVEVCRAICTGGTYADPAEIATACDALRALPNGPVADDPASCETTYLPGLVARCGERTDGALGCIRREHDPAFCEDSWCDN